MRGPLDNFDKPFSCLGNPSENFDKPFGRLDNPFENFDKPFRRLGNSFENLRKPFGILNNPFSRSIASVQTGELPVCYPFGSRAFHPFKGKLLVYVFPREVTSFFGSILVTEFSAGKQYFPITT